MPLSRRAMLGLTLAGAVWPLAPVWAKLYANRTGLQPGQFVWDPTAPRTGPVLIVVSLSAAITHVYRGGRTLGFSTFASAQNASPPPGVYTVLTTQNRRARLTWSGVAVHETNRLSHRAGSGTGAIALPYPFAELLHGATQAGSLMVVARERTETSEVIHESLSSPAPVAGAERQADAQRAPRAEGSAATVVISGADELAHVIRRGVVETRTRVVIREPRLELGTQVYAMVEESAGGGARWLGLAAALGGDDPHFADWQMALDRMALVGGDSAVKVTRALKPGALLVITDASVLAVPLGSARPWTLLESEAASARPRLQVRPSRIRPAHANPAAEANRPRLESVFEPR
jgi:hypothetical protein